MLVLVGVMWGKGVSTKVREQGSERRMGEPARCSYGSPYTFQLAIATPIAKSEPQRQRVQPQLESGTSVDLRRLGVSFSGSSFDQKRTFFCCKGALILPERIVCLPTIY